MGCGASAPAQPPKDAPAVATAEPVVETWATKKQVTPNGGSSKLASSDADEKVMLLDAEDNEEIEFIYETQPNRQVPKAQPAAANGQEPPEAFESDVSQQAPKPLPARQQEEAAKLAERRKRFDNQRYQKEQRSDAHPLDVPGVVKSGPISIDANSKLTTDMIMGLNLTEAGNKDPHYGLHDGFLPGGILDDAEDMPPKAAQKKTNRQQHEDLKSNGFDADDEKLMKEILDNFDNVDHGYRGCA